MYTLEELSEHPVFSLFRIITQVPHPSKVELPLAKWVMSYADQRDWPVQRDTTGNVLISVPPSPGYESVPSICLQAHLDMVCLTDKGVSFGAQGFPLRLVVDGDWLTADGTTLGADNGIGIALALAVAHHAKHGPLELLFTVQEETGLVGAQHLGLPIASTTLLNLDSEEWGTLYIGCTGGSGLTVDAHCAVTENPINWQSWKLIVSGLQGGHSGLDIAKGRLNAIRVLAEVMALLQGYGDIRLVSLNGGSKSNAIPQWAEAVFTSPMDTDELYPHFRDIGRIMDERYTGAEPKLALTLDQSPSAPIGRVVTIDAMQQLLRLILELPHDVITMSDIPDIPRTSISMGTARFDTAAATLSLMLMGRSAYGADLDALADTIEEQCRRASAQGGDSFTVTLTPGNRYPGWIPEPHASLVQDIVRMWGAYHREPLEVTVMHAGLECGLLKAKLPEVAMVSLGPDIQDVHSANERVHIPSVDQCFAFLKQLLIELG